MEVARSDLAAAARARPVAEPPPDVLLTGLTDLLAHRSEEPASNADDVPVTDIGGGGFLRDVLHERRSCRQFSAVSLEQIGVVMARVGLNRHGEKDAAGIDISSGPCPSAGGRHPIHLVLLSNDVHGLHAGGFVLDPDGAVLRRTRHSIEQCTHALEQIGHALRTDTIPPAAVVAVAHPLRTLSRYPDGMSLLWRDAGAVLAILHLVATDLGLASCIVGTSGIFPTHQDGSLGPVDLGAVALGEHPESVTRIARR